MLRESVVVVVVALRTCPRTIPLSMTTMRKSTYGFPFLSNMSMGLRLAARLAAGALLLDVLLGSIAEFFDESCRILTSV